MSNASNNNPSGQPVRKTIAQIRAERTSEDERRLQRTDTLSDAELTHRATADADNPPLTDAQLSSMRQRSVPTIRVQQLLDELGDDPTTLAAVLDVVSDRLRAATTARLSPTR